MFRNGDWFLRDRPYTDYSPAPAQLITRYMFARKAHDGAFRTLEEEGVHPTRARVAELRGTRYTARRRSSLDAEELPSWTELLRRVYASLRTVEPGLADIPPGQIYVDMDMGVVKVGNSRVYFDIYDEEATITDVLVEKDQRRMGVGELLVETALGALAEGGVKEVRLRGPMEAPGFWTRMGFSVDEAGVWRRSIP